VVLQYKSLGGLIKDGLFITTIGHSSIGRLKYEKYFYFTNHCIQMLGENIFREIIWTIVIVISLN
jgi:hypothetical protein